MCGLFTLHEGDGPKDYTDNSQAIFFRSFSVDQRYRGRGIGRGRLNYYLVM